MLLNSLFMPSKPELAAKWLAERQTDKSTLDALRLLSTADNEGSSKLKAMLMLFAEQRFQDSNKPGSSLGCFPFTRNNKAPFMSPLKRRPKPKRKNLVGLSLSI
ncbi:hypothetical protein P4S70_11935 [Enterovibrio sp. Hal110]